MIGSKELSRRETMRAIGTLDRVLESVEQFIKRTGQVGVIKQCNPSRRGHWYRMRYGMQFREGKGTESI